MLRNIKIVFVKKLMAIALIGLSLGAAAIPSIVSAQGTSDSPSTTRKLRQGDLSDQLKQLNLTESQKAQIKKIYEDAKAKRQSLLTAEQRAIMEQARQSGDRKGVKKSLNLTEAQKQQMKAIGASTKTQVENVLTPEQKAQLEKLRQDRQAQRGNRQSR